MYTLDASSIVFTWDNYPLDKFESNLYAWLAKLISKGQLTIPEVALKQVKKVSPDCHTWLLQQNIHYHPLTNRALNLALRYKGVLGIVDDNYHPKGVDESDLFIIATASEMGKILISEEAVQKNFPNVLPKCKIPAVCNLNQVNVKCIRIIDLINTAPSGFK